VGINAAIRRVRTLFVVLFVALAARQVWVQVIAGPRIAADAHNPRSLLLAPYRGSIVARDGTVLARSGSNGRSYPYGSEYAHAVGYVSARYGTFGLESAFDSELSPLPPGNDPISQILRLSGGNGIVPGSTVVTTLDPAVQNALAAALAPYPRAAGVALDPRTGEVLGLVSVPSFDPNTIDARFTTIAHRADAPLVDRAIDGLYPPGSTFKVFIAASALEAGVVTPQSTFTDPGYLDVGNAVLHDDESEATGTQDLTGAFALSSNVDFGKIALDMGVDRWFAAADQWKLGSGLGFTLPSQSDHLPSRASVSPGVLAQLGFGQADLLVTPMRMALIAATIATGGTEPRPFLVRAVRDPAGRIARTVLPGAIATPISSETAAAVRDMMIACVQRGTGTPAALPGVTVAGKTGTATNSSGRSHAWFVAFAPAQAPQVVVAVVVENVGYGATYAAPVARRALAAALASRARNGR
jgi:peptidoglycan glycosyltransferase